MRIAILHLGGDPRRVEATIRIAHRLLSPEIIVSSEAEPQYLADQFDATLVARDRVTWDYQGWDTVSQFALLRRKWKELGVDTIFVVTDHWHLRRSLAIGRAAYAWHGIRLIGVPHFGLSLRTREPLTAVVRDVLRVLLWRLSGIIPHSAKVRAERRQPLLDYAREAAGVWRDTLA